MIALTSTFALAMMQIYSLPMRSLKMAAAVCGLVGMTCLSIGCSQTGAAAADTGAPGNELALQELTGGGEAADMPAFQLDPTPGLTGAQWSVLTDPVTGLELQPAFSNSRSKGWPWQGELENGVRLRETAFIRFSKNDIHRDNFFATEELVSALEDVTAWVDYQLPGGRLVVGELSSIRGKNLVGHRSHESGRDVDAGFYFVDNAGVPKHVDRFVRVGNGHGNWDGESFLLDTTRTWLFVEGLLRHPEITIKYMVVSTAVKRPLMEEAERLGVSEDLRERAVRVMIPPGEGMHNHRNHFHIRIYCDESDLPDCRDRQPFWPWVSDVVRGEEPMAPVTHTEVTPLSPTAAPGR